MFTKLTQSFAQNCNCYFWFLTLTLVCCINAISLADEAIEFTDEFPTSDSPYRLNHQLLLGVSSDIFFAADNGKPQLIDGTSFGASAEFFYLPVLSIALLYNHYNVKQTIRDESDLSVNTLSIVQRLAPLANSRLGPYLSLGFGSDFQGDHASFVLQGGFGLQFRPSAKTWARIGSSSVVMGSRERLLTIPGESFGFLRTDFVSRGLHFEFGIVF